MSLLLLYRSGVAPPPTGDVGKSASVVLVFVGQSASNDPTEQDFAVDPSGGLFSVNPGGDVFQVGPGGALIFIGKTSSQGA